MKTKEQLFTQRLRELWPEDYEAHRESFGKSTASKRRVAQWMVLRTRRQWQLLLWSISVVIAIPICAAIYFLIHPIGFSVGLLPAIWLGNLILHRMEFGKWRGI